MRGAGPGDEADGSAGPGDEADGDAGPGDEADGARRAGRRGERERRAGRRGGRGTGNLYLFRLIFAVWVEIYERRLLESLPFRVILAVWVEIYDRRLWESLPFSADFRCLGRDFLTRAFSPWHRVSCHDTGFPPGHGTPGGNPMAHTYIRHSNYINGSTFRHDQAEARATTLHTKKPPSTFRERRSDITGAVGFEPTTCGFGDRYSTS